MNTQEEEEMDFIPMGPSEEMRWQHAQGMRCSFDCAACDPWDEEGEALDWLDSTPYPLITLVTDAAEVAAMETVALLDPWF